MDEITEQEMIRTIGGASRMFCGVGVGATIGSTVLFGMVGFAVTVNKALAACTIAAFR